MITLIKTPDNNQHTRIQDHTSITMEIESGVDLPYLLDEIDNFLRAIGYVYDGKLEIVEPEQNSTQKEKRCLADDDKLAK